MNKKYVQNSFKLHITFSQPIIILKILIVLLIDVNVNLLYIASQQ